MLSSHEHADLQHQSENVLPGRVDCQDIVQQHYGPVHVLAMPSASLSNCCMRKQEAGKVAGITRWLEPMQLQTEASGACHNPGTAQAFALHPVAGQHPQWEASSQWTTAYGSTWSPRLDAPGSLTSAFQPANIAMHSSSTLAPGSTRGCPCKSTQKQHIDAPVASSNRARCSSTRQPVV